MLKSIFTSFVFSAALAAPASAQLGQFPTAAQQGAGMYWNQVNTTRFNYARMTGYDGMAPSWQNPNAYYYSNGMGVAPCWSTYYPGPSCNFNYPIYAPPPAYGPTPYPPVYGGNSGGWSIGIGVGFGGTW